MFVMFFFCSTCQTKACIKNRLFALICLGVLRLGLFDHPYKGARLTCVPSYYNLRK